MAQAGSFSEFSLLCCLLLAFPFGIYLIWIAREWSLVNLQFHSIRISKRLTGKQIAYKLLRNAGFSRVPVIADLSETFDNYDTSKHAICLTPETAGEKSISSTGIVIHEIGHALQDQEHFWVIGQSENINKTNLWSGNLIIPVFGLGLLLDSVFILFAGWALFCISTFCNLLLYYLNWDASARGEKWLRQSAALSKEEDKLVEKFLRVANLSYLSGVATNPLRIFMTVGKVFIHTP
jgi:Zn-dependent membrane protease YugP